MSDGRISESQLAEIKDRHPCDQVAAQWVTLRRQGRKSVGPCPICSDDRQSRTAARFECDADGWVCAVCADGGDVIKLIQRVNALEFRAAVEWLGGARQVDQAQADALAVVARAKAEKRERDSNWYRETERSEMFKIWGNGERDLAGSAVAGYLERRRLEAPIAGKLSLRALDALSYFEAVGTPSRKRSIARAPAMLAPITNPAGHFAGLHMTYLDLSQPGGKLALKHPETGEGLPAKKIRGSMQGNRIELVPCAEPRVLVIGEGIETVLSVWRAWREADRALDGVAFWSAIALGNLAGKSAKNVGHPSLKTDKGRPRMVPGPDPDSASPAVEIPDSVVEVIILGDGDSDPFSTEMAVYRAGQRFARPGRVVRVAWSPPGQDFNDLAPAWSDILAIVDAAAPPAQPASSAADQPEAAARKRRAHKPSSPADAAPGPAAADQPPSSFYENFDASPAPPGEAETEKMLAIGDSGSIDPALILEASEFDHSDTANARRLQMYFGADLAVMAQTGDDKDAWLAWSGKYWDMDGGNARAIIIAQRVGDLIKAEADVMAATPREQRAIDAALAAAADLDALAASEKNEETIKRRAALQDTIRVGREAKEALGGRKVGRRKHGVASRNASKIDAMLRSLAPHLRRSPDDFNRDPMLVVTQSHTLRFSRTVDAAGKVTVGLDARRAHDRTDLITAMIPLDYDPAATCPLFLANMERFQPEADRRRTIQQFTGLGLLGSALQKVMYHYGTGGNFKSVFLEVITRVLGDSFAIGLPAESISGREERSAGQASPDLARVFGKRMLRVLELPDGIPLQPGTIKKLTGGEKWPVRTLFKGYFEFQPRAKTHMSGNSLPHFDGSDGGMRRRLMMVEWPVTLAAAEQRDFEDVVGEMIAEAPGILNWLIAGALDFLEHGLVIAPSIEALTLEQIGEMDPIGQFFKSCCEPDPHGEGVSPREIYTAYKNWSEANAKRARSENKFGREAKKLCVRDDGIRGHLYRVRLHDVPAGTLDEARANAQRRDRSEPRGNIPDDDSPIV